MTKTKQTPKALAVEQQKKCFIKYYLKTGKDEEGVKTIFLHYQTHDPLKLNDKTKARLKKVGNTQASDNARYFIASQETFEQYVRDYQESWLDNISNTIGYQILNDNDPDLIEIVREILADDDDGGCMSFAQEFHL